MKRRTWVVIAVITVLLGWAVARRLGGNEAASKSGRRGGPAAVEVAAVEKGTIEQRRTLMGTLAAREKFVVSAYTSGRVKRMLVQLADPIEPGQVVAELEDDGKSQDVAEAGADLAAARAAIAEAESALQLAERDFGRIEDLQRRGVSSDADLDLARAQFLARQSSLKAAQARYQGLVAGLDRARLRSGYAKVVAAWNGDDQKRFVAERHVTAGDTVRVGDPVVTIVALEPLDAIVNVTEKEYANLHAGQIATVTTDAYPGETFPGTLERLSPIFNENSRQARVEIAVGNDKQLLKPGMFVRVELILRRDQTATIVPQTALVYRGDRQGVFVVNPEGSAVSWRQVEVGIRDGHRVAVKGEGIEGRVVTLGHQLVEDGSEIIIPKLATDAASARSPKNAPASGSNQEAAPAKAP